MPITCRVLKKHVSLHAFLLYLQYKGKRYILIHRATSSKMLHFDLSGAYGTLIGRLWGAYWALIGRLLGAFRALIGRLSGAYRACIGRQSFD
jgi:hypothetical protein